MTSGVLALQRRAGNRAVASLLREAKTKRKPPPTKTVSVSVVPNRPLTGPEFSALVAAQLYGVSELEARARQDDLRGSDPHFTAGVRAAEVGTPIRVDVVLPELGVGEQQDARTRAAQFAGLSETERRSVDDEANRRYSRKRGVPAGTTPTDLGERQLWMRTRDEVVRDRNRIEAMPEAIRDVVMQGGKLPGPERYATGLRIGEKLGAFGGQDWALYTRRGGPLKGDLSAIESSIDRFAVERADDRKVLDRVRGTEQLYGLLVRFRAAQRMGMKPKQYGLWPHYQTMLALLAQHGFRNDYQYELACLTYLKLFRTRARELAMLVLKGSEQHADAELRRTGDMGAMTKMFADLGKLREHVRDAESQVRMHDHYDKIDLAKAEKARLAAKYPILQDPSLDVMSLAAADPASLGVVLREAANDRLEAIRDTRARVKDKQNAVFKLDRIVELTHLELGDEPGSVGRMIVQTQIDEIKNDESFKSFTLAILAIGLGMLTFGGGTVAVLGGAASVGVGAYQAHDEWEKYSEAAAAAHTAFDPALSVSSKDPSAVWFALALVGTGLDALGLGRALRAARPAIKTLQTTGDVAQFEAKLAQAADLTPALRRALKKAAAAEKDFIATALRAAKASGRLGMNPGDPTILKEIALLAYHAARVGIRKFEVFLAVLKARKNLLQGIDVDALTVDQRRLWNRAFAEGISTFDAGRPRIAVPSAKGPPSVLSFGDQMLLDGKPVSLAKRNEIIKRLGLAHADRGHGAARDVRTIANEAWLNFKPTSAGTGMSGIWASDEIMLKSAQTAIAMRKAGLGTFNPRTGTWVIDFAELPSAGRAFMVSQRVPANVTPVARTPFTGLPVDELPVNNVRAFIRDGNPPEIVTIFPSWIPNPKPRPLNLDVD